MSIEKIREAKRRYKKSEKGKATEKRYRESELGKKSIKRAYDKSYRLRPERLEQMFKSRLKRKYGLTLDDYKNILAEQKECCSICKVNQSNFNKKLAVDHCHKTGKVRGLLCQFCNQGLGNFKDNKQLLDLAIKYLEKHKGE